MKGVSQLNQILDEIKNLNYSEQVEILEGLVKIIKDYEINKRKNNCSLLDLKGLGKEIWKDVDIESYIDREREEWE